MYLPDRPSSSLFVAHAADGLRRIVQVLRLSTHVIERRHGLSGAQLFVLQQLSSAEGLSLAELAAKTRTDPSSVSGAVSRLRARRLVLQRRAADDARRAEVSLSAKGKALLRHAPEPAQARLLRVLESLPKKELAALAATLERVASSMGAKGGPAPMFFEGAAKSSSRRAGVRGRS